RPPLTTLAERLMNTTFSINSCSWPSPAPSADSGPGRLRRGRNAPRAGRPSGASPPSTLFGSATRPFSIDTLKLQAGLARRVGQSLYLSVKSGAAPVEHNLFDALAQSCLRGQAAEDFCGGHVGRHLFPIGGRLARSRRRRQRPAGVVVNELDMDVLVREAHA